MDFSLRRWAVLWKWTKKTELHENAGRYNILGRTFSSISFFHHHEIHLLPISHTLFFAIHLVSFHSPSRSFARTHITEENLNVKQTHDWSNEADLGGNWIKGSTGFPTAPPDEAGLDWRSTSWTLFSTRSPMTIRNSFLIRTQEKERKNFCLKIVWSDFYLLELSADWAIIECWGRWSGGWMTYKCTRYL